MEPLGLTVVWIDQVVPFHLSASVKRPLVLLSKLPTAVHMVEEEHETAASWVNSDPAGLGVDRIVQVVPFQASARVTVLPPPPDGVEDPTAMQAVALAHETPTRLLSLEPATFGVGTMLQMVPFQLSASVVDVPPTGSLAVPTAMQLVGDGHEIASRLLYRPPAGFGVA